jgi:hypothetical protein
MRIELDNAYRHALAVQAASEAGRPFYWLRQTAPSGRGAWGWSAIYRLRWLITSD